MFPSATPAHKSNYARRALFALVIAGILFLQQLPLIVVQANSTAQPLNFSQNWANTGLITANDDWSGVAGIEGFLGDRAASGTTTNIDPQSIIEPLTTIDVIANQSDTTILNGGVAEFETTLQSAPNNTNPTVALQGSGTADHPNIVLYLNATGKSNINVAYSLRDIDCTTDNAAQQVALQYRVGNSGNFTNLPAGYVADATTGPSLCTLVTPKSVTLPAAADNQPLVQVRIITSNAALNDEWVGIDDIVVTGSGVVSPTNPSGTGAANPNSVLPGETSKLTVSVTPGANPASTGLAVTADLSSIGGVNNQQFFDNGTMGDVSPNDNIFTYDATVSLSTTPGPKTLPFTITDAELRSGNGSISLTVQSPPPPSDHVVISQIYGGGGNTGATYRNDYIELYNPTTSTFNLNGWSVQYASATGNFTQVQPLAGPIGPGEYYLVRLASGGAVGADLPVQANVEGSINMSATAGKVVLANDSANLTGGSNPCTLDDPNIVDFVGFGTTANCREGAANAPGGNNTTAIFRLGNGTTDTNQNGSDFTTGAPNPRRTAIILDSPPTVSATDTDSEPNESTPAPRDGSVAVFFSEPVEVSGTWYDITCVNTGTHTAVVAAGPRNWVITPDVNFQPGEQCTIQIFAANVKDADTDDSQPNTDFMQANYSATFTVATGAAPVYTPDVHLTMGNPSNAVADTNQPNNYLSVKPELALSYNRDKGTPNWVSWHLSDDWTGTTDRVDTFRPDPALPSDWNRVNQLDYTGSGFDRGHMVPSADRLSSLPINQATFLMDNIIPQAPDNNQQTWNNMEQALRSLYLPANELYIVSGGAGVGGTGSNGFATTIAGGKVTVPAFTWKVALVIPKGEDDISRVDCSTRSIAVIVPNTQGTNPDWTTYLTTVDAVETLTGYDFFSNLPEPVQRCVEAGTNGNNPPLDTDNDTVPDSTDNCPFTANTEQVDSDGDLMGNACDADDDNDGVSDEAETAAGSDPLDANSTPEICDGVDNDLNDGIDEGFVNTDGDSQADCVDTDDDNDGVTDADEITAGSDPLNANSTPEVCDGVDNDLNEGTDEGFTNTDGDAQANCVDADDDNDGVSDAAEISAGSDPLNSNSTPEVCDGVDNDLNEGIDEGFPNTDGDGQANCVDTDDDNDGVSDTAEIAAGSDPLNANSKPEVCDGVDNDLNEGIDEGFPDSDHDGRADCVDNDADNDGVPDATDNCPSTPNPTQADSDNDGIGNACEQGADLRLEKLALPKALSGKPMAYGIVVKNYGPNSAPNVVITDVLPAGTTFVSAIPTRGSCSRVGQVVTCNLGTLPKNWIAGVALVVKVNAPVGTIITNTAQVVSSHPDPNPGNNTDTASTKVVKR
jgi:endonuclease G, mitochondrial